nr:reverse transcriptase domain-containing protein [Tanacetum cinerariifolium]
MSFEISFTNALILKPKFASTLKALIGNKEKLSKMARTPMKEHCLAIILNKLPRKLGDPDKFLIPCVFLGMNECLALEDLDRLVFKPIGVAKDVSFKVGVFHFPADFVVVNFEPDPRVYLILGRCFLKTGRALIDVHKEVAELKDLVRALLLDKKNQSSASTLSPTPAPVKAVEPSCVTCGGSGTLPSNTIANPKEELKAVFVVVDFEPDPRVPLILGRCFLKTGRDLIDVHKGELTLRIRNKAIPYNLDQTVRYSVNYNQMTANKIDVIEMACEEYSQEVLGFSDVTTSGNPTPHDDLIISTMSPTLTLFRDSDFLLFEEADAFLGLEDDPDLLKINPFYYDPEGDILLLKNILFSKPLPPFPNHEQYLPSFKKEPKVCEAKTVKPSVDEPPEVELKDLPPHLEYAFLEGDNKLPVIIAKELGDEEKSALIKVLKSHKKRQRSPIPTECLPINACLLACAMYRARFKGSQICVGNKMHKAFPLPGEISHWQYKFPLLVKVVPTAKRLEMPLPEVCTVIEEMMKKLPVKDKWQLH